MQKKETKKALRERWSDADFVTEQIEILRRVFSDRQLEGPADLRGIPVGVLELMFWSDFHGAKLSNVDMSCAKLTTSFSMGEFRNVTLSKCEFDSCSMNRFRFIESQFSNSRFRSPRWYRTEFIRCDFSHARLRGRWLAGDGPDRTIFRSCNFSDVIFTKLKFQGAEFHDCRFEGTRFVGCFMLANDFYGSAPSKEQFEECTFRGRHRNLEWYDPGTEPPMFRGGK